MPIQGPDNMKRYWPFLIIIILVGTSGLFSCKKNQNSMPSDATPVQKVTSSLPAPTPTPEKEKQIYAYSGDQYRDPFMPAGASSSYQSDTVFDAGRAIVKGIIFGPELKTATLILGTGGSYFVKSGRIFDVMGKTIEGFSAKVFADKVVIQGESDNVYELKIKNPDEEAKK